MSTICRSSYGNNPDISPPSQQLEAGGLTSAEVSTGETFERPLLLHCWLKNYQLYLQTPPLLFPNESVFMHDCISSYGMLLLWRSAANDCPAKISSAGRLLERLPSLLTTLSSQLLPLKGSLYTCS
jgi:hypothetical protein